MPAQLIAEFTGEFVRGTQGALERRCTTKTLMWIRMSHSSDKGSHELTCEGSSGNNVELKVGTKANQHIVAVKPEGKGSSFSLVYVRTHGKEADI